MGWKACTTPIAVPERTSAINGLHLREAAIHEQFRSRDVAAVVGCQKHHGLGDVIERTESAERNSVVNHLQALLARF
jgi:hypothetical protein